MESIASVSGCAKIMATSHVLKLKLKDVQSMKQILARPSSPAGLVRRIRVVLWTAEGLSGREIAKRLALSPEAVSRIRARYVAGGVKGLFDVPKAGRKDHAVSPAIVAQIVECAMSPPPAGRSRWTTRLLAREFRLTSGCISDVLRRCELKPHLISCGPTRSVAIPTSRRRLR